MDKENLAIAACIVFFIAILIGSVWGSLGLLSLYNSATCNRYGNISDHEVRSEFPGACYVKTDKGWFTTDQIRSND